eukprot:GFUD01089683.1.p1 GENE.GFUD01089683.1~~GFUD01089683.1.p1  ORF type:complete len:128 (-),score=21.65 GFUD01089683.1:121-504(-)
MNRSLHLLPLYLSLQLCAAKVLVSPFASTVRNKITNTDMIKNVNLTLGRILLDTEKEIVSEVAKIKVSKLVVKKRKLKMLTKFELTITRCCSSDIDRRVDRCFEVNGFGGIQFIKRPCEYLQSIIGK